MSIVEGAKCCLITKEMRVVTKEEGVTEDFIRRGIAEGHIFINMSSYPKVKICGIGAWLRTKVNALIGTSSDIVNVEQEHEKARHAELSGADSLMELSTSGAFPDIRKKVCDQSRLSVGLVPLYQAFIEATRKKRGVVFMDEDDLFNVTGK